MRYAEISDVTWDVDVDEDDADLPTHLLIDIPNDIDDEDVEGYLSDYLSDTYGYCHYGFNYSVIEK